jgi:hypothetical protein
MAVSSRGVDSGVSSLGPSNSASQQQASQDLAVDKLIEDILTGLKSLHSHPPYLPITVLWDYGDCEKDTSEGAIITKSNKSRPRMQLAICHPDGTKVSSNEYSNIRHTVDIIIQKLIKLIHSDPHSALYAGDSRLQTKSFIRKFFKVKYDQAKLSLEAEQPLLHLCLGHWKADNMIIQALSRRSDVERATNTVRATSVNSGPSNVQDSKPPEPSTALLKAVVPVNASKRAHELSPGHKSPSVSRMHKHSKENTVSGQETVGSCLIRKCPTRRSFKLTDK